jgi:gliding motility-associated-like protein/uncharacterized repeat protein (TIGR01451 family)
MKKIVTSFLLFFVCNIFLFSQVSGYKITMLLTDSNKLTVYAKPNESGQVKWLQNAITLGFPASSLCGTINKNDYTVAFNNTLFGKAYQGVIATSGGSAKPVGYSYASYWSSADQTFVPAQLVAGKRYEVCSIVAKRKITCPIRLLDFVDMASSRKEAITVIGDNSKQHYVNNGSGKTSFYSSMEETDASNQKAYAGTYSTAGNSNEFAWVEVVPPLSDILVTISVDNKNPKINDLVIFSITTTNLGPATALNVITNVSLPSGYDYIKSEISAGTNYDQSKGKWNIGTLYVDNSLTMKIYARVKKDGDHDFTVSTGSDVTDPVTTNNTDTVVVTILNSKPTATADPVITTENTPVTGTISATDPDGDPLTFTLITPPVHGGTITLNPNGTFTYTPPAGFSGTDSFTVLVSDGKGGTTTVTIPITVLAKPKIVKYASKPVMKSDGTFAIRYTFVVNNSTPNKITDIQIDENLDKIFEGTGCTYHVHSLTGSQQFTVNSQFDGSTITKLLADKQSMTASTKDSVMIDLIVDTKGQALKITNTGTFTATLGNFIFTGTTNAVETQYPEVSINIPDVITPNGDGTNDYFVITHPSNLRVEFSVFNRWGNVIYQNDNYQNDWGGTGENSVLGNELKDGTYYCSYKLIDKATAEVVLNGAKSITIIRK